MDTSTQIVTAKTPPTSKTQRRSITEKRRIVEETLSDGASVARVAMANGVNANQVFYWRKVYQAGKLSHSAPDCSCILNAENLDPTDSV
jgi:transposase